MTMAGQQEHGAAVIASILRWHLPGRHPELDTIGAEIWAKAIEGEMGFIRWQAEKTARQVGAYIEAAGVKLGRRDAADMANRIEAELRLEASRRGQRDVKPRPHLFTVAPYEDTEN